MRTAVVVPSQGEMHLKIDHSHPYTNKARTAEVMLARASTKSLTCAQSSKPLSDAQVDTNSGGGPKEDCQHWDEEPARYPERNMVLPSPTCRCCTPQVAQ